jgi:hypothetical protein
VYLNFGFNRKNPICTIFLDEEAWNINTRKKHIDIKAKERRKLTVKELEKKPETQKRSKGENDKKHRMNSNDRDDNG